MTVQVYNRVSKSFDNNQLCISSLVSPFSMGAINEVMGRRNKVRGRWEEGMKWEKDGEEK